MAGKKLPEKTVLLLFGQRYSEPAGQANPSASVYSRYEIMYCYVYYFCVICVILACDVYLD